jgi:hypothetical protein
MGIDSERLARVSQIARDAVSGQIGPLEATRALLPYIHSNPELVSRDDFNLLRGIDSETDDLPLGRIREEWHPESLAEKDGEIARSEKLYGDKVRSVCERILMNQR